MDTKLTVYVKKGNKWLHSYNTTDARQVYKSLATDLLNQKLGCNYIKSIRRVSLYNGYQKVTTYYDNNTKTVYIVENH